MRSHTLAATIALGALALGLGAAGAQDTAPQQMTADPVVASSAATHVASLANDNVIPPVETTAGGTAWLLLDSETNTLSWTVEFAGLTGPATAASFHGPAGADANAPIVLGLVLPGASVQNPIQGSAQLTDEQAAQVAGGQWYVSLSTGNNPEGEIRGQVLAVAATAADAPADDAALVATLMTDGQAVYRSQCQSCHGAQGEGGNGPELAGYTLLANTTTLVNQIINGGGYMPPFGYLDDHSIAAVATYARNAFGNAFGVVTEPEVQALR